MYSLGPIIDTQIGIAVLYLFYRLLLSGRIPLYACRAYLLLITPVAIATAWVKLPVLTPVAIEAVELDTTFIAPQTTPVAVESFDYLFWLYVLGAAVCVLWSLVGLVRIGVTATRSQKQGGVYLCKDNIATSSFFSLIFVNERYRDSDLLEAIIVHERLHSRYLHSLDLLYINALRALLWFNPALWLIGRSLSEVHECQADRRVMDLGFSPSRYIEALLAEEVGFATSPATLNSLTHSFSYSLTKNRIKMITKFNKRLSTLRLLVVLPVLGAMLCMMSFTHKEATPTAAADVSDSTLSPTTSYQLALTYHSEPTDSTQTQKATKVKVVKGSAVYEFSVISDTIASVSDVLIIINGKESSSQALSAIAPDQIKSMSILKDKTSSEIYGEKGKNGVILVETKNANKDASVFQAEEMPRFQGGDLTKFREWIRQHLIYPDKAVKERIEGRVTVSFVIEKDGRVSNVEVLRSPSKALNAAAIDVIKKSPLWEPGKNHGEPVEIKFLIPIDFKL